MPTLQQSKAFGDLQGLIFSYVSDIRLLIVLKLRNVEMRPPIDRPEPIVQAVILLVKHRSNDGTSVQTPLSPLRGEFGV